MSKKPKKGEELHRSAIVAMEEHTLSSGCVVRCESNYVEGKAHSHRWHAAEQARAEKDVYTMPLDRTWRIVNWGLEALAALQKGGGLAGAVQQDGQGRNVASLKPFHRSFIPFPHNAHHIVPMGVLWQQVIEKAVAKAGDRSADMFNLVIGGFLTEPYNHHDRPNMITLPTRNRESVTLGLPMHLKGNARAHPRYSAMVAEHVRSKVPPKYDQLAADLKSGKHVANTATVDVKTTLVTISKTTYAALMAVARAKRGAGSTLEDQAAEVARDVSKNLPKALARG